MHCRLCGSYNFDTVIDLGSVPLANRFLKSPDEFELKYPLRIGFCGSCTSLQVIDVVEPKEIFSDYVYLTSANQPMVTHFQKMANDILEQFLYDRHDLMVELGGNDGSLLLAVKDKLNVLNVDPAKEAAVIALACGIPTIYEYFDETFPERHNLKRRAKFVVANNVMAHIPDLMNVLLGVESMLTDDGVFVMEVHWVGSMLTTGGFDHMYHEHIYYHSLTALNNLVNRAGLTIWDVQMQSVHGGSIRVFIRRGPVRLMRVPIFMNRECQQGLDRAETFLAFGERIKRNKSILHDVYGALSKNSSFVGYGAPAKSTTLLNYYDINLDYVIDTTPLKQGRFTPGKHIPVRSPDYLYNADTKPDYLMLLAWNYADSILEKEKSLINQGIRFLIPVPNVRIV